MLYYNILYYIIRNTFLFSEQAARDRRACEDTADLYFNVEKTCWKPANNWGNLDFVFSMLRKSAETCEDSYFNVEKTCWMVLECTEYICGEVGWIWLYSASCSDLPQVIENNNHIMPWVSLLIVAIGRENAKLCMVSTNDIWLYMVIHRDNALWYMAIQGDPMAVCPGSPCWSWRSGERAARFLALIVIICIIIIVICIVIICIIYFCIITIIVIIVDICIMHMLFALSLLLLARSCAKALESAANLHTNNE